MVTKEDYDLENSKTFGGFIIFVEQDFSNKIKTSSGLEFYIDPKFNKAEHRAFGGVVVATPVKYETGVMKGDFLLVHHNIIINDSKTYVMRETPKGRYYFIPYETEFSYNSLCYGYIRNGVTKTLNDFIFVKPPVETEDVVKTMSGLYVFNEKKSEPNYGYVYAIPELNDKFSVFKPNPDVSKSSENPFICSKGLNIGDEVYFTPNSKYKFKVGDDEFWRMRYQDIIYKI